MKNTMMKKIALLLLGLSGALTIAAQNSELAQPESVVSDGKFLYITNIGPGEDQSLKDGNGYISKYSLDGKMITQNISNEILDSPKGTSIINGILYVADFNRIVGINLANGNKVTSIDLSEYKTVIANDLAVKNDHVLFVSATDVGKVLEIDLTTRKVKETANVKGANGLYYNKSTNELYVCSLDFKDVKGGEVGIIRWQEGEPTYKRITTIQGAFDGITLLNSYTLLVSDWGSLEHPAGFLEKIDLRSKVATKLKLPIIHGPADFYLDRSKNRLIIPALKQNKIIIENL
jgi:hypothetical protein